MRLGAQCALTGLRQQLSERLPRIHLGTQHLSVDEEPDQPLGVQAWTVGIRHTDTNVALAAVAVQQTLESGE
ncbi:hypothetical protein D3C85_1763540 [compost metagenome]